VSRRDVARPIDEIDFSGPDPNPGARLHPIETVWISAVTASAMALVLALLTTGPRMMQMPISFTAASALLLAAFLVPWVVSVVLGRSSGWARGAVVEFAWELRRHGSARWIATLLAGLTILAGLQMSIRGPRPEEWWEWLAPAILLATTTALWWLTPPLAFPVPPAPKPVPLPIDLDRLRPPGLAEPDWETLRTTDARPEPGSVPRPFPVVQAGRVDTTRFAVGAVIDREVLARFRAANDGVRYQRETAAFCVHSRTRELFAICRQAEAILARLGVSAEADRANHLIAFVQCAFEYAHDHHTTPADVGKLYPEYGRYPIEMLNDGHGDCDCKSILLASILVTFGYRVAILPMIVTDPDGKITHHWAVGVAIPAVEDLFENGLTFAGASGRRYFYAESTGGHPGFGVRPSWSRFELYGEAIELPEPHHHLPVTEPPGSPARVASGS
jgi:hypothetical protein